MTISIFFEDGFTKHSRDKKGKSILELPNDYIVLDIETTGLDPDWDSIIEIGAIKVIDNKVVESFESLINPEIEIDDFITDLTGELFQMSIKHSNAINT